MCCRFTTAKSVPSESARLATSSAGGGLKTNRPPGRLDGQSAIVASYKAELPDPIAQATSGIPAAAWNGRYQPETVMRQAWVSFAQIPVKRQTQPWPGLASRMEPGSR